MHQDGHPQPHGVPHTLHSTAPPELHTQRLLHRAPGAPTSGPHITSRCPHETPLPDRRRQPQPSVQPYRGKAPSLMTVLSGSESWLRRVSS